MRVVVRYFGGVGVMSADSKDDGTIPDALNASELLEKRDTLRGVGDPLLEDTSDASPTIENEAPRLHQKEFTVPPLWWKRPPSGWFRSLNNEQAPSEKTAETEPDTTVPIPTTPIESKRKIEPDSAPRTRMIAIALGALVVIGLAVWVIRSSFSGTPAAVSPVEPPRVEKPREPDVVPAPITQAPSAKAPAPSVAVQPPFTPPSASRPLRPTSKSGSPTKPPAPPSTEPTGPVVF